MSKNKTKRVYVVINSDDQLEIEAICASREALEKYMNGRLKQYEKSLNKKHLEPELKIVKRFSDEKYEISVDIPTVEYEVLYEDIDISITTSATYPKVWVVYHIAPNQGVSFFLTKTEAEKYAATIDYEDCPKELTTIQKYNLL